MAMAGWAIPADGVITLGALPGGRAKEQTGQRTALTVAGQILEVLADVTTMSQIMMLTQQGGKEAALAGRIPRAQFDES